MNDYTKTPVNTVIYVAILSLLLGLLAFAGPSATNAIFSLSIVALYVAYAIPIAARFVFKNDFQPGPFTLGRFVSSLIIADSVVRISTNPSTEYARCCYLSSVDVIHGYRFSLSDVATNRCRRHELHRRSYGRYIAPLPRLVLLPKVRRRALV